MHITDNIQLYLAQGPSPGCARKTIMRELSQEAKEAILEQHNELRRKVAKGQELRARLFLMTLLSIIGCYDGL